MEIMGPTHLLYGKEERRNAYQETTLQVVIHPRCLLPFCCSAVAAALVFCAAATRFVINVEFRSA